MFVFCFFCKSINYSPDELKPFSFERISLVGNDGNGGGGGDDTTTSDSILYTFKT